MDVNVNEWKVHKVHIQDKKVKCFLSSFDYTFVQENTIKNIFQNAICEVIVFSNKTPIGQSNFMIARCTPSAKVEEL